MSCCTLAAHEARSAVLRKASLLLAVDFDGTIAPIVPRPDKALIAPPARRLLERCVALPSVLVAVLSGRDVHDLRERLGQLPVFIAGSHGLECLDAHGQTLWSTAASTPRLDPALRAELQAAGLFIEPKKFAVSVHFRGNESPGIDAALARFIRWALHHDLQVVPGRKVVEARVAGEGKGAALRRIATHSNAGRVIYAGDDFTDFEALAFAAAQGRAIFVRSSERRPPDIAGLGVAATVEDLCLELTREVLAFAPDAPFTTAI